MMKLPGVLVGVNKKEEASRRREGGGEAAGRDGKEEARGRGEAPR